MKAAGLGAAVAVGSIWSTQAASAQDWDQDKKKKKERDEDDPRDDDHDSDEERLDEDVPEETRACPQCGDFMYKQGNTWTCDTCGYSYVE